MSDDRHVRAYDAARAWVIGARDDRWRAVALAVGALGLAMVGFGATGLSAHCPSGACAGNDIDSAMLVIAGLLVIGAGVGIGMLATLMSHRRRRAVLDRYAQRLRTDAADEVRAAAGDVRAAAAKVRETVAGRARPQRRT